MRLTGDYHMHSSFSGDCKNELEAIVKKAIDLGLKEIAITDHGPAHSGYGIKKTDYPLLRAQVDALKHQYPNLKILLGLEANILGPSGEIDLSEDMQPLNDWLNAGYHFGSRFTKDFRWHIINFLSRFSNHFYEKAKTLNTEAMVQAMKRNKITMITHPGAKGPIDMDRVASVAAETGTMLEINSSHGHLTVDALKVALKYPVMFVVNSDAHHIDDIGNVTEALNRVIVAGVPLERLYNVE